MIHPSGLKPLLITSGDPEGIGPEIIQKALQELTLQSPVIILGSRSYFTKMEIPAIRDFDRHTGEACSLLEIDPGENDPSFMYVSQAVSLALDGRASGIVTGPVSKKKWIDRGHPYMGHTDFLVKASGSEQWAMFFWSDHIKTALYTTHIPLRDVFSRITREKLISFCRFIDSELSRLTGRRFRLLVSGLNPHAGENGTLGLEEEMEIIPAITALRGEMDIEGPYPPDTVFLEAEKKKDQVVVSLYHDQGLIPFKLMNIHSGVNVTLGLPFVRTSPDHGTAYDIAGKGVADPGSMIEALKLADRLVSPKP